MTPALALAHHFAATAPLRAADAEAFSGVLASWRRSRRRVLVIEDDATLAGIIVDLLGGMDLRAESVGAGGRGVTRTRAEAFDLVIVDLHLHGMHGMAAVEAIRRESVRPQVPILVISGAVAAEDVEQVARDCGADAALAKPFSAEDFAGAVRRLLDAPPQQG